MRPVRSAGPRQRRGRAREGNHPRCTSAARKRGETRETVEDLAPKRRGALQGPRPSRSPAGIQQKLGKGPGRAIFAADPQMIAVCEGRMALRSPAGPHCGTAVPPRTPRCGFIRCVDYPDCRLVDISTCGWQIGALVRVVPGTPPGRIIFGCFSERNDGQAELVAVTSHGRATGYFISAIEFEEIQRLKAFARRGRA